MKRLLLAICLLIVAGFCGFSQSLALFDSVGGQLSQLIPNATVYKQGTINNEVVKYFAVKNLTGDSLHVKVKKFHVDLLHDTQDMFCWGLCYGPDVFESPWPKTIHAGEMNVSDFSGHYIPNTVAGISTIRYTFFVSENINDSVCVTVVFSAYPLGENELAAGQLLSKVYPNPAAEQASFSYNLPVGSTGRIIVRNLLGANVINEMLPGTAGKMTLDTRALKDGLYFYTLLVNGEVKTTQKMIVKH